MSYCVCGCRCRWLKVSGRLISSKSHPHKLGLRSALGGEPSDDRAPASAAERILRDFFWRQPEVAHTPTAHLCSVRELSPDRKRKPHR
jgi:hypothetical protein